MYIHLHTLYTTKATASPAGPRRKAPRPIIISNYVCVCIYIYIYIHTYIYKQHIL